MMRSRQLQIFALVGATLLAATAAFAQSTEATPEQRLLTTLRQLYPATTFTRVQSTPVPGLYEVALGNNVAYAAEDGRYFVFGHLFDLQTQRDLTVANMSASARSPVRVDFTTLPLADAIKTVRGDGRRVQGYVRHAIAEVPSIDLRWPCPLLTGRCRWLTRAPCSSVSGPVASGATWTYG